MADVLWHNSVARETNRAWSGSTLLEGWKLGTRIQKPDWLGSAMVAYDCGLPKPGNLAIGTPGHHDPGVQIALVPFFLGLRFCTF